MEPTIVYGTDSADGSLADRDAPVTWEEMGATDIWQRAREDAKRILAEADTSYLSTEDDAAIRSAFPILM